MNQTRSWFTSATSWFLSNSIRPSGGFASFRRVLLYGMFHAALSRQRILFIVTTEAEAIEALARDRPGMLLITTKLDQGDGLQLVERARSIVDDIRTIVLCDQDHDDLVAMCHSSADVVICEQDLIDLWVEGLGDRQTAERLGVSYATTRSYGHGIEQRGGGVSTSS